MRIGVKMSGVSRNSKALADAILSFWRDLALGRFVQNDGLRVYLIIPASLLVYARLCQILLIIYHIAFCSYIVHHACMPCTWTCTCS